MSGTSRVLVTGGSGFVAANLVRRLLEDGHEVHLLLRPSHRPSRLADVRTQFRAHLADLQDGPAVAAVVAEVRPAWVFHLAAHGAYPHQEDPAAIFETNVLGTVHLVEACLRTPVEAFINTGTSSEYGPKDHAPSEDEALDPINAYGISKASATAYCRFAAREHGLPARTLRLYSTYGAWEEPTRLVPKLLRHAIEGRWPPLASPCLAHDFIHVEDVVEAYLRAARAPDQEAGAVYNIGTGTQTTLSAIVTIVRKLLAVEAEPVWGSMRDRPWDTSVWVADPSAAWRSLHWRAEISLEDGLARTLEWWRSHPNTNL